jgi:hypothetical protein
MDFDLLPWHKEARPLRIAVLLADFLEQSTCITGATAHRAISEGQGTVESDVGTTWI